MCETIVDWYGRMSLPDVSHSIHSLCLFLNNRVKQPLPSPVSVNRDRTLFKMKAYCLEMCKIAITLKYMQLPGNEFAPAIHNYVEYLEPSWCLSPGIDKRKCLTLKRPGESWQNVGCMENLSDCFCSLAAEKGPIQNVAKRLRGKMEGYDSGNRELKRSRRSTKFSEKMIGNKEILI